MKKIKTLLVILASLLLLCACSDKSDTMQSKYNTEALPEGTFYLGHNINYVYPYNNLLYTVSYNEDETGSVGTFDLTTNEYNEIFTCDGIYDFFVDKNGVYLSTESQIHHLSLDGTLKDTYEIPANESGDMLMYYSIAANDDYIIYGANYRDTKKDKYFWTVTYSLDDDSVPVVNEPLKLDKSNDDIIKIMPTEKNDEFYLYGTYSAFTYNVKTQTAELQLDDTNKYSCVDYVPNDEDLHALRPTYSAGREMVELISLTKDGYKYESDRTVRYETLYNLKKAVCEENGVADADMMIDFSDFFYVNGYYMLKDMTAPVVYVYSADFGNESDSVTVLGVRPQTNSESFAESEKSVGYMNSTISDINADYMNDVGAKVNTEMYSRDTFIDKLRVRMLAGDKDIDVVCLEKADELIASILRYDLYLPLETSAEITAGFDGYIDGVRDAMTYNGHIFGIPYYISANGIITANADMLPNDYSLDDFFSAVDASPMTFGKEVFTSIVQSVIEDEMAKNGKIDKSALVDVITKFNEHKGSILSERGVKDKTIMPDAIAGKLSGIADGTRDFSKDTLRHAPSVNGKSYIGIESMVFVSANTQKKDNALKYAAYFVSDDYLAEQNQYDKSLLARDVNSYFKNFTTDIDYNSLANGYARSKFPAKLTEADVFLITNGADLFTNASPRVYSYGFDELIGGVYDKLKAGSITPTEAADEIYSDVNYKLAE